jgi:hypothetical protein
VYCTCLYSLKIFRFMHHCLLTTNTLRGTCNEVSIHNTSVPRYLEISRLDVLVAAAGQHTTNIVGCRQLGSIDTHSCCAYECKKSVKHRHTRSCFPWGQLAVENGVQLQQSMRHCFYSVMPIARGHKGTFNLMPLCMKAVWLGACSQDQSL